MPDQFLHGVQVSEITSGPRPIRTVNSAIIGLVGTAPNSEAATSASLTVGAAATNNGIKFTAAAAGIIGNNTAVRIFNPGTNSASLTVTVTTGATNLISISLATDGTGAATTTATALLTNLNSNSAVTALVTPTAVAGSSGAGVVLTQASTFLSDGKDAAFPLDTPVLVPADRALAARLGTGGTLPAALNAIFAQAGAVVVVVRVAQASGSDTSAGTLTNVIGSVSGTGQYLGMQALLGAESQLGVVPRILCAPGFTHQAAGLTAMVSIADRLRAVIVADGPNTTDAAAQAYAGNFGSSRIFLVDPGVQILNTDGSVGYDYASAYVAGVVAKTDNDLGFWWSPSNKEILGITGTKRAIDFVLGDVNSRANILNSQNVATIIRQSGYRVWGNRSLSSDPKFAFLCVRRTADMINDSILRAHLWAVDRAISKTYLRDVVESVNGYLRTLQALGAILGGRCWADPTLNTPANISQGKVYFNFEFTPPYPAENITFQSLLTNNYLSDLVVA
jgi:phage tail sheath protein FI